MRAKAVTADEQYRLIMECRARKQLPFLYFIFQQHSLLPIIGLNLCNLYTLSFFICRI